MSAVYGILYTVDRLFTPRSNIYHGDHGIDKIFTTTVYIVLYAP